jgi:SnoaL-like domain
MTTGHEDGGRAGRGERAGPPVPVVLALYEAMRDGQVEDVLALVDPGVVYKPLDHWGPGVYCGHEGMIRLVQDVHATYGDYQVKIVDVAEEPGPQVTVQVWVVPEPGRGLQFPMRLMFTLGDGLVTSIQSLP